MKYQPIYTSVDHNATPKPGDLGRFDIYTLIEENHLDLVVAVEAIGGDCYVVWFINESCELRCFWKLNSETYNFNVQGLKN